jgi:hypothetical protein
VPGAYAPTRKCRLSSVRFRPGRGVRGACQPSRATPGPAVEISNENGRLFHTYAWRIV